MTQIITPEQLTSFLAVFIGVMLRIVVPAWLKKREIKEEGKKFVWDHLYTKEAISALLLSFVATMMGVKGFSPPTGTLFDIGLGGMIYGFGLTSSIDQIRKWKEYV